MRRAALVFAVTALVLMAPALLLGAPAIDSATYTHVWTEQYAAEMARGVVYPRWLPDSFEGLGSPTFYFYPPLAFHLSGFVAMVMDVRFAVSWAAALMLFGSGLAMYAWLRGKASEAFAVVGGLLYMAGPYHLTDFYVRSAQAEFGAFVWVPLIALAIERARSRWGPPLLALSYAGLICTHLPVALLTSVVLIPPLVLRAAWKDPMAAVRCAVAGIAGVATAALYLLPALTLQGHTLMPQVMWAEHFDVQNWSALGLLQPGADPFLRPMTLLALGWAVIALTAMARGARFWPLLTLGAAIISLGLTPIFNVPIMDKVQFPWRALAIVEFAAITAVAVWRPRPVPVAVGVCLLIIGAQPFFTAGVTALRQRIPPEHLARVFDAVEYFPSTYTPVPRGRYPEGLEAYRGPLVQGRARLLRAAPDAVELRAEADGLVTIRKANFPRWRIEGPQGTVPIKAGPLVTFEARAGETYRLEAAPTRPEIVGGWISLLGLALTLLLWLDPIARLRSVRHTPGRGT